MEANLKAQQGWLYPLPGALLYVGRPALFLRPADLTSLELLRAGEALDRWCLGAANSSSRQPLWMVGLASSHVNN